MAFAPTAGSDVTKQDDVTIGIVLEERLSPCDSGRHCRIPPDTQWSSARPYLSHEPAMLTYGLSNRGLPPPPPPPHTRLDLSSYWTNLMIQDHG